MNRPALADVQKFGNYLYILSRNHTFNALRQTTKERERKKLWLRSVVETTEIDTNDVPPDYMPLIDDAIAQLPQQQQAVYILRREKQLSYEMIAEKMDISPDTVRKHMTLANRFIKGHLKKNLPIILLVMSTTLTQV
jgi:RNA polymerase sigma-70 factor (ECF subfamily)